MKKEDIVSLIVYAMMIVLAVVVGLVILGPTFSQYARYFPGQGTYNVLFALLFVVSAIIVNVVLIELGHAAGAKMGGYKVVSINMLGLCFHKTKEKWKVGFKSFDGLTGETKVAPVKENATPKAYSLFPLVMYVIEVVVCMSLYYVFSSMAAKDPSTNGGLMLFAILCLIFVTVGGMLELYNIFPAHLDSTTDGYRLVVMSKQANIAAYNELMRIESAAMEGVVLDDIKSFDEITNFTASINLYKIYFLLGQEKYKEAEELIDKTIEAENQVDKGMFYSALSQKLFLLLVNNESIEEAKKFYDEKVSQNARRAIANDLSMESIRAYLLISGLLDESEAEARYAIIRKPKAIKRTVAGRKAIEENLFEKALNIVDKTHPNWNIKEDVVM